MKLYFSVLMICLAGNLVAASAEDFIKEHPKLQSIIDENLKGKIKEALTWLSDLKELQDAHPKFKEQNEKVYNNYMKMLHTPALTAKNKQAVEDAANKVIDQIKENFAVAIRVHKQRKSKKEAEQRSKEEEKNVQLLSRVEFINRCCKVEKNVKSEDRLSCKKSVDKNPNFDNLLCKKRRELDKAGLSDQ